MIEDRNGSTNANSHWKKPAHISESASEKMRIDKLAKQDCHIENMVEKDALSGVLIPVCGGLDVGSQRTKITHLVRLCMRSGND